MDQDQALPNKLSHWYQKNCLHLLKDNNGVPKTKVYSFVQTIIMLYCLLLLPTLPLATVVKGTPPSPRHSGEGVSKLGENVTTTFMNIPLTTVASGAVGGNSKQQSIMIVCTKEYTLVFGTPLLSLSKCKHFLRPGYIIGIV